MHPFLRSPKTLLLMLLSWLPICIGTIALNTLITKQPLPASSILLVPGMLVELFICMSIWYLCRTFSLDNSGLLMVLLKHIISMLIMVAVWLVLINIYSIILDQLFKADIWHINFKKALPILIFLGFFLYFLSCLMYYLVITVEKAQKAESRILEQKLLTSQSELKSLKALIHPHFLFNSLTALSTLTISDPILAKEICVQLSDFFRYNLKYSQKENTTVADELKHVENYLSIEKMRFGNRLRVDMAVDDNALSISLLPLTLLTVVENAVKHGIQQSIEGGTIFISVQRKDPVVQIKVSNPFESAGQPPAGEGYGLKSLRQRMHAHYGEEAHLYINKKDNIFSITLTIPVNC